MSKIVRVIALVVLVLGGSVGYGLWYHLLRAVPDTEYPDAAEHFKYGVIGLGTQARIPYYLWEVLPTMFADKLPKSGGWSAFGVIEEPGHDTPVGFARRRIGYPSVEPNCAFCHSSTYRSSPDARPVFMPGAPAHTLDLAAFQWFLYDCAADPRFTPDNILREIKKTARLGLFETQVYRFIILPVAKRALADQRANYAWQKLRPRHGPGRTDTFNPTKINVFHLPDDHSIGTVDLPATWNQRPREGLYLHWDGNNNQIRQRNFAAAMAIGATPQSVHLTSFKRVTDYLLDLPAPKFPFPIDAPRAVAGGRTFQQHCASCHAFGQPKTGQVTAIDEIGTDRHRLDSFTQGLVDRFHAMTREPFVFSAYRKTDGYSNVPLDGVWARAPYLHNGSVPTLWDLLQAPERRPKTFRRGSDVVDRVNVGFLTAGPDVEKTDFEFDTALPGNSNSGHSYGVNLSDTEKRALIEYLKTL